MEIITPVLLLDLGTTTGWAAGSRWPHIDHGHVNFAPTRFESASMRYVKFRAFLNRMQDAYLFQHIVFEQVHRHSGVVAAHVYGGLLATFQVWCEDNKVSHEGVQVQAIKKHATGKRNANKDDMKAAVSGWHDLKHVQQGGKITDDNEADAVALARLYLTGGDR